MVYEGGGQGERVLSAGALTGSHASVRNSHTQNAAQKVHAEEEEQATRAEVEKSNRTI